MAEQTLQGVLLGGSEDLLTAAIANYRDKNSAEVSSRIVDAQLKQFQLLNSVERQYGPGVQPVDPRQTPPAQTKFMVPQSVIWVGGGLLALGLGIFIFNKLVR